MNNLRNHGYIIIENKSDNEKFDISLTKFYKNNKVDYIKLKEFIDKQYFSKLHSILHIPKKPYYNKFNFTNNLISDSTFYSDIYNHTNDNIINIYSCLYYFDNSYLEIIPQSHKKNFFIINNCKSSYDNKMKFFIKKGSFLIFHSNIHHRHITIPNVKNTKILKIYNVCFDKKDYDYYLPKIIIVKTHSSILLNFITKMFNNSCRYDNYNIIPFLHYYLIYYDLQYKIISMVDLSPSNKKNKLILYESSNNQRNIDNLNNITDININIICDKNIKSCGPGYFYFFCYIVNWIILTLIFYFIYRNTEK